MENQSKYIMIERNKFAALVKAHRKCLQILSILTYAHTVKIGRASCRERV